MKKKSWMAYLAFILLAEAVGVLAGLLTRNGLAVYETVPKSALTPPAAVFPAVWTILYALMGVGAARVYLAESSLPRTRSLAFLRSSSS